MMNNLKQKNVGEESITTEIKNKSTENECESITKEKWTKKCPKCNRIQHYSSLKSYYNAVKKNSQCLFCKNKGNGNPFFGRHHENKHRQKMSDIQLKSCSYRYKKIGKNPDKIEKRCSFCGDSFEVIKSLEKQRYCSYLCAINDNFGFDPLKKTEPEKKFETWLQSNNISYKSPYPLKGKLYDFYIPSMNMLVEIDGIYWHGKGILDEELSETQKLNRNNDRIKDCIAKENGYNLLRIWEDEIKNVSKYLHQQERLDSSFMGRPDGI